MTVARRVLLLGLSGADWSLLRPLLDDGGLPNLADLLEQGSHGRLRSLQPQFDPLLWTSIATGRRADAHRVLDAALIGAEGQPEPVSALNRRVPALWNFAAQAGFESILVNWPLTFPAEPVPGCCVSDAFFRLAGDPDGLLAPPEASVSPHSAIADLRELRLSPARLSAEELSWFARVDGRSDPMVARLAVRLAEQVSVHAVAMDRLTRFDWQLMMLRYDFIGALGPEFMGCHPPQLPWVPDAAFDRYQHTMARAATYLDHQLGHLIASLPEDTGILLFSERGLLANEQRPASAELAAQKAGQPWYADHGLILMTGSGIADDARIQGAGLLDLAPTVLHWLGLELADGLEGRVLAEAFQAPTPPRLSGRPAPTVDRCGGHASTRRLDPIERDWLIQRWRETGVDPSAGNNNEERAASAIEQDRQFTLAMVLMDAGRPKKARPVLENLYREVPEDSRIQLHLARCRQACGDLEGARDLLEAVVDHARIRPNELMALARLYRAEGRHDEALACLFRAEQAEGERPTVHCRIGEVYLEMERLDEAERGFSKALERDHDHGPAHIGMARLRLAAGEVDAAVDHALRAVEHNRESSQGHYWLARALVAADRPEQAAITFETLISLRPGHVPARRELADILDRLGRPEEAVQQREQADRLEMQERMNRSTRELLDRWART